MNCPRCGATSASRWFCPHCGASLVDPSLAIPARRAPGKWARRFRKWSALLLIGLLVGCTALLIAAALDFNPAALILSIAAAAVPAVIYSSLVLSLDRYEKEPRRAILAAFGWGAVAAVLLAVILEAFSGSVLIFTVGQDAASFLELAIAAPFIEETTKGIALLGLLWFFRDEFDNVLDGLIYGALIGLGFAMTENMLYFGTEYLDHGAKALGQLFIARVVIDGFGHAVYTATTGAAVGWSRTRYDRGMARIVVPVLGWSLAVLQHALWNGSLVLIGGLMGDDVSLLRVVLIQAPLFTLPPLIILVVIARVASRRELAILKEQLAPEVAHGVLTPREYEVLTVGSLRREVNRTACERGGRELVRRQRRFSQVAAELAFRKYHLSRGERPKPNQRAPEDAYRAELAHLREELATTTKVWRM